MTARSEKKKTSKEREVNFTCKFCQRSRPLTEMVVLTRFFPPIVACRDCERKAQ